ncbi:MAG TPA: hypothetical protein VFJ17_08065 [Mycobacteriales bacterium]|jgi:hypothetical protein|nr:hypothetical protein [Mycobacteriales bacterium]
MTTVARRLWLTAGWAMLGYVVLTFAGAVFESNVTLGDTPRHITEGLVTSSMTKAFTGGYIEFIAGLVFLAAALLVARLLRGSGELTGWLSSCISGAAIVYTAVGAATGAAAGAAAVYNGHHGAPLAVITTVNDIRNIGFTISGGIAGLLVLAIAAAGRATGLLPRWFCYAGYVVGVVMIAAVPAAKAGAPQTLLFFAWLVALGVLAVRAPRRASVPATGAVPVSA